MLHKYFIVFTILIVSIFACVKDDGCGGPFPNLYKVVAVNWESGEIDFSLNKLDSIYYLTGKKDSITFDKFGFIASPITETFIGGRNGFSFIPSAYACSPIEPKPAGIIEDVIITSIQDFDDQHPKGSNVTELFEVYTTVYLTGKGYVQRHLELKEYLQSFRPAAKENMIFLLKNAPSMDLKRSFKVKIKYNGEGIKDSEFVTSETLILNK